jgi:hypothetical protein
MDPWVDHTDPDIIEAITGSPTNTDGVYDAVAAASEILTMLTGFRGHAAGVATQEYVIHARLLRLTPAYKPVTDIIAVEAVSEDCVSTTDVTDQFCVFAGDIRRTGPDTFSKVAAMQCNFCSKQHERLRVEYVFGSTVGAAAKRAVVALSRQLWLSEHPGEGECILPERVTSLNREGLSYSFIDPMAFLDDGRTGVPYVDSYLAAVNPSKAKAPAAVYIPEAPPGVIR